MTKKQIEMKELLVKDLINELQTCNDCKRIAMYLEVSSKLFMTLENTNDKMLDMCFELYRETKKLLGDNKNGSTKN